MDLEIIILSIASQKEKDNSHDIAYTWNLKYDTNQSIYKTETEPGALRIDLWLPRVWGVKEGWTGNLGLRDANWYT